MGICGFIKIRYNLYDQANNVKTYLNKDYHLGENDMLLDVVKKRYSCRKYIEKEIEKQRIYECIETARLAPSACNSQPWMFYVVLDETKRKEMVKLTQPFTKHAAFIVIEEKKPNVSEKIVNAIKHQDFTKTDIGIACSYLSLQASELGLGTCMIGYFNEDKIKQLLGINNKSRLRLIISIGYPDEQEKHKVNRKHIDEIMKIY